VGSIECRVRTGKVWLDRNIGQEKNKVGRDLMFREGGINTPAADFGTNGQ